MFFKTVLISPLNSSTSVVSILFLLQLDILQLVVAWVLQQKLACGLVTVPGLVNGVLDISDPSLGV